MPASKNLWIWLVQKPTYSPTYSKCWKSAESSRHLNIDINKSCQHPTFITFVSSHLIHLIHHKGIVLWKTKYKKDTCRVGVSTKPTQIDATASRHLLPLSAESRKAAEKKNRKNRKTKKPKNRKTENRKPKTEENSVCKWKTYLSHLLEVCDNIYIFSYSFYLIVLYLADILGWGV